MKKFLWAVFAMTAANVYAVQPIDTLHTYCLLYTSDAADDSTEV